jgi:hypothetical protein
MCLSGAERKVPVCGVFHQITTPQGLAEKLLQIWRKKRKKLSKKLADLEINSSFQNQSKRIHRSDYHQN